jgi:hypothetical protein
MYINPCPLSALCRTLLAQVHMYLPTVSTVQHLVCSGTQVLAHCQHCAPHSMLSYPGTCPMSALCTTLLAQVLAHSQHCAAPCLLKYAGTCPLSAICSTLLAQIHRYFPNVSIVDHIACSGTQVLAHSQHCAPHCMLRYTGSCPLSALCSTLLAQVHRYLHTVSTVQHLDCSCTKILALCQHFATSCLFRYTDTCPLSALRSTLLVQVHRYLPTVSTVQHLACSGTQVLAHCQ